MLELVGEAIIKGLYNTIIKSSSKYIKMRTSNQPLPNKETKKDS